MRMLFPLITALAIIAAPSPSVAAEDAPALPEVNWHHDGIFGSYDKAALQRGYQVFRQVCSGCHSMGLLSYRNLEGLGYDESQIKAIASEYTVMDGPNDEGEMFERPAKPSDRFVSPYPNKQTATAANGAYPPDMSLISKARAGGATYVYSILTGYDDAPEEYLAHNPPVPEGKYYNKYMTGHIITMAPPLAEGMVAYADESPQTVEQYAKDVAQFIAWAAEPKMEERKRVGLKVFLFLLVFTGVMYAAKRKLWSNVPH